MMEAAIDQVHPLGLRREPTTTRARYATHEILRVTGTKYASLQVHWFTGPRILQLLSWQPRQSGLLQALDPAADSKL